ncbi:hypothetical protein AYR59_01975 [Fructilactobacillus lindneri]|uniref:Uncharacterized protein n=2 Tax=Fructilactobacillus lindneri TaxID=53444 RepID=A0A0R2JZ89_9LACO|nr:hypothetical protein AYR60_01975 [Fructilactobacillus lindneri]ANZ58892.1 hypothetical protein AYR59_01975 [Fructilactobacillus lindneri]KRN79687.1 hypothetical protein IV52_GL000224 [Fructilactobacillus lindneri DSM 20690 = JCM 11027]SKA07542.1 O-succinylbenzoate synthase [Fructilactobacillus lindneri DSM 20690 = JCM 11027]
MALAELNQILPNFIGLNFKHPTDLNRKLNQLTSFARTSVEMALWDAYGKTTNQSLSQLITGKISNCELIPVGTVLGIQANLEQTSNKIKLATQQGYRKIKFKAANYESALTLVKLAHQLTPKLITTIDANQAWENNLSTINVLKTLEANGLQLIEEPLKNSTFVDYTKLQQNFSHLMISLDESLTDLDSVKRALNSNSAKAFTIKQGKLGGISAALTAIDLITQAGKIPWIGGMLTSGLGRSVDLALATQLKNSPIPADISASNHYFEQDFINETIEIHQGLIKVPQNPGIGVTINWKAVSQLQNNLKIQYK